MDALNSLWNKVTGSDEKQIYNFIDSGDYASAIVTLIDMGFTISHEKLIMHTSENVDPNNFVIIAEKNGLLIRIEGSPYYMDDLDNKIYVVSAYKMSEATEDADGNTQTEAHYKIIGDPIPCFAKRVGWVIYTILKLVN